MRRRWTPHLVVVALVGFLISSCAGDEGGGDLLLGRADASNVRDAEAVFEVPCPDGWQYRPTGGVYFRRSPNDGEAGLIGISAGSIHLMSDETSSEALMRVARERAYEVEEIETGEWRGSEVAQARLTPSATSTPTGWMAIVRAESGWLAISAFAEPPAEEEFETVLSGLRLLRTEPLPPPVRDLRDWEDCPPN